MSIQERVGALIAPVLAERDLDLYDLEVGRGMVKVVVDAAGPVDLDQVAAVTRAISGVLDEADPIEGHYTLEVTTPGVERNLRSPEHFARAVGEQVKVKVHAGAEGERRLEGTVAGADDAGVTIRSADGTERLVRYEEIDRARTVFVWGPSAREKRDP
ncbi:MAG: ribosome maturation factor RimP [Acidimicrobiia bacterium]